MRKRILSIIVVASMIIATIPMIAYAAGVIEVTDCASLKTALQTEIPGETALNPTTVLVKNNIVITETIGLSGTQFKNLVADGDYTISRGDTATDKMFNVGGSYTLNIGGNGYSGVLTFDGALASGNATSAIINTDGVDAVTNINTGVFQNNKANGNNGALRVWSGTLNLYNVTVNNNTSTGNAGAIYLNGNGKAVIDGATIINNVAGDRGGAAMCEKSTIIFNSGLIKGNDAVYGSGAMDFSGDSTSPGIFYMYDGVIDDATNPDANGTDSLFEFRGVSSGTIYGGTIQNSIKSCFRLTGSTASLTLDSYNGNKGVTIQNGGINAGDGGAVVNSGGTFTMKAGTISNMNCLWNGGAIDCGNSGVLNLLGGKIMGCKNPAIRFTGSAFNMGGSFRMAQSDRIYMGTGNTITVVDNLTTTGGVATFDGLGNGTQALSGTPELIASNASHFSVLRWTDFYRGVNTLGIVDDNVEPPVFGSMDDPVPPTGSTISLGFTGIAATVNSNVAIASAELIVVSYDASGNMVDVETFPVAVEANVELQEAVTNFSSGSQVKVMLWDSLDTIKPLADVLVQ